VVTFGHLLHFLDSLEKSGALAVTSQRDGYVGSERVTYGSCVYESGITADDSAFLEFVYAIGG
jgi:hypothetical protein